MFFLTNKYFEFGLGWPRFYCFSVSILFISLNINTSESWPGRIQTKLERKMKQKIICNLKNLTTQDLFNLVNEMIDFFRLRIYL